MSDDKLQAHEAGYDAVATALAHASAAFWKEMLGKLAEGKVDKLNTSVTPEQIEDFFMLLSGAEMNIGFLSHVVKGNKCIFDGGQFPGPWKDSKDSEKADVSVGLNISVRW